MTLYQLQETKLSKFTISEITARALEKRYDEGSYGLFLKNAILNYPNTLILIFETDSTYGDDYTVGPSGQGRNTGKSSYEVQIRFNNISKEIPSNFTQLLRTQQKMILENLFQNNNSVQVDCDCPAHYWQSGIEKGSKIPRPNNRVYQFAGTPGKDIWSARHGNKRGTWVCKHIYQAIDEIYNFIPQILKMLSPKGGRKSLSSSSATTKQPINKIKTTQPAGQPKEKQIKSKKVIEEPKSGIEFFEEPNFSKNIEVTEEHHYDKDHPYTPEEAKGTPNTGRTSSTKARKVKAKNSAAEGVSAEEPSIEEPEMSEAAKMHSQEIEEKNNDLEEENIQESLLRKIFNLALRERWRK